jgi:hypothetical protein
MLVDTKNKIVMSFEFHEGFGRHSIPDSTSFVIAGRGKKGCDVIPRHVVNTTTMSHTNTTILNTPSCPGARATGNGIGQIPDFAQPVGTGTRNKIIVFRLFILAQPTGGDFDGRNGAVRHVHRQKHMAVVMCVNGR